MRTAVFILTVLLIIALACLSIAATTVTLNSTPGVDGFVTSSGSVLTITQTIVGDTYVNTGCRGFVSFNIMSIPPGSTIISAALRMYQEGVNGTPYTNLGSISVDHVDYGPNLDAADYDQAALQENIGILSNNATLEFKTLDVTARLQDDMDHGRTRSQYRLLFPTETDNDGVEDATFFTSANVGDNTPELVVTYQGASPVIPDEGTVGTEISITGSGFGTKKGRVYIGTKALKILAWDDELIQCLITRSLPPESYDVLIKPKGIPEIILEDTFSVVAPEIDSVNPTSGSIGDNVTIHGVFFGTKKGKVTLSNKNCKILRWEMDPSTGESEIDFVVPKVLGDGTREVKVTNSVGAGTTYFTVGTDRATSFQYPMNPYVERHRYFDEWTDNYGGKYHAAQDCLGEGGDRVYAVANGVVSYSYGEGGEWGGYGYVMTIDHQLPDESWYYSLYGHLSTRRWKKEEGKPVYRGELIGYVGDDDEDGSSAWGPHLHFGIRAGKKSDYLDFLVGYYSDHPALHGWVNPGEFIEGH